jgi:hypothetical protein
VAHRRPNVRTLAESPARPARTQSAESAVEKTWSANRLGRRRTKRGRDGRLSVDGMRFGLLCTANVDTSQAVRDYVEFNVEAEALGFVSTFLVEHHFSGWNQVAATLMLQTCVACRTSTLRLGTGVMVLPWHNPGRVGRADRLVRRGQRRRGPTGLRRAQPRRSRGCPGAASGPYEAHHRRVTIARLPARLARARLRRHPRARAVRNTGRDLRRPSGTERRRRRLRVTPARR